MKLVPSPSKSVLFAQVVLELQQTDNAKTYEWRCHNGQLMKVTDMQTDHICNTIRLLWNHTVPVKYRVEGGNHWQFTMPFAERSKAIHAMLVVLSTRKDLTEKQIDMLHKMFVYTRDMGYAAFLKQ